MNSPKTLILAIGLGTSLAALLPSGAQTLPGHISFNVSGRFQNAVAESQNSILLTDNDLTDGHASGADLHDAPSNLLPGGPAGSAMFQWGTAANDQLYPHPSALWFEPLAVNNVAAEQIFYVGYLYYRNGTIQSGTGASAVDLRLTFTVPGSGTTVTANYTSELINTPNTGTDAERADIVSLANLSTPLGYQDAQGNTYHLELAFQIDSDTISNSLSNSTEFRVYEGSLGRAEMIGRITTTPGNLSFVPEPSSLILASLSSLALMGRNRRPIRA